jgi:hypothetical protein
LEYLREQKALMDARKRERRARPSGASSKTVKQLEKAARGKQLDAKKAASKSRADKAPLSGKPIKIAKRPPPSSSTAAAPKVLLKRSPSENSSTGQTKGGEAMNASNVGGARQLNAAVSAALHGRGRGGAGASSASAQARKKANQPE